MCSSPVHGVRLWRAVPEIERSSVLVHEIFHSGSNRRCFFAKSNSTNAFTFTSGQLVVTQHYKVANVMLMDIFDQHHIHTCV